MTNFEKIKKMMSVHEIANIINNGHFGNSCDYCIFNKEPCTGLCVKGIIMWLNSEVEE